ncbi:Disease resistance protein [Quillaja saponaria]|uniref:Disease resistance protein n=1 Tax=Quillaja saponaria TaxID=32244 RepID=A0AAD7LRF1_QUISA|nr:Disease resistance protein [Quillaja saponaria]
MHDVIRDMALWVACEHGSKPKFGVFDSTALSSIYASDQLAKWREAERLSLWHSTLPISLGEPFSLNLLTMMVGKTGLNKFPKDYFKSGQALKVLDLSHNANLVEIPAEIGELTNLQYLNLSHTRITELPIELNKLKRSRCLMLNFIGPLTIPKMLMSSLSSLQVFSELMILFRSFIQRPYYYDEILFLGELECLEDLKDISIVLFSFSSLEMLLNSTKLQRRIKYLRLEFFSPEYSPLSLNNWELTRHERIICNLQNLEVTKCGIPNLTWLTNAPNLRSLKIVGCDSINAIVSEDFGAGEIGEVNWQVLGSLETLELRNLPRLRSICQSALRFPSLKNVNVYSCNALTNLPFDSDSARSLERIVGETCWWNSLDWEDQSTKDVFSSRFQDIFDYSHTGEMYPYRVEIKLFPCFSRASFFLAAKCGVFLNWL